MYMDIQFGISKHTSHMLDNQVLRNVVTLESCVSWSVFFPPFVNSPVPSRGSTHTTTWGGRKVEQVLVCTCTCTCTSYALIRGTHLPTTCTVCVAQLMLCWE